MTDEQKILFDSIFNRYGNILLTKLQMSEVCNVPTKTLDRHRENGKGCEWRYEGGRIYYPLHRVVKFLDRFNQTNY